MNDVEIKFVVINKKHLKNIPSVLMDNLLLSLKMLKGYIPDNKYYVCNQDEPYAGNVLKLILEGEKEKGKLNRNKNEYIRNRIY